MRTCKRWAIVRGILGLAGALKLSVTADGIETATQHVQLRVLGCERGQGFLFAKPLDAAELGGLIASKFTLSADARPARKAAA